MSALIIFLHGSGGTGPGIRVVLEALPLANFGGRTFRQVADLSSIDILTPTANKRPYTPAYGDYMTVWFDRALNFHSEGTQSSEDIEGVDISIARVCLSKISIKYYLVSIRQYHLEFNLLDAVCVGTWTC